MKTQTLYFILLLFFFQIGCLFAQQENIPLQFILNDNTSDIQEKKKKEVYYFSSTEECVKEGRLFIQKLRREGYLSSYTDSFQILPDAVKMYYYKGSKYKWVHLEKGNADEGVLSQIGYREKMLYRLSTNYETVSGIMEKMLNYYENHGYPFASVKIDSIRLDSNHVFTGKLKVQTGKLIIIDSLILKGEGKFPYKYLENYLNIKAGKPYNETNIRNISNRLQELPFVTEIKPFEIEFFKDKPKVYVYLANKKASRFDAIAGVAPDANGNVLFTGDVKLNLINPFKRGEMLDLNWRNPQIQTQDLKMKLVYPFLLNSPFGLDLQFNLYKKDSTFIDIMYNIGVQYLLSGGNFLKVFVLSKESFLIKRKSMENFTTLPAYADIFTRLYGLGYKYEKLDYRLNPRKGVSINVNIAAGTKKIRKNDRLKESLYDGIKLNSNQISADYTFDFFIPLSRRIITNIGFMGGHLIGSSLFSNELFRIGGFKNLRGFNEESIWASSYDIFKLEQRFILEKNSYMFIFFNAAYYENYSQNMRIKDIPFGFGPGITFETQLGIFSFNYGLGKEFKNDVYLRSGKIHFGFVSYF